MWSGKIWNSSTILVTLVPPKSKTLSIKLAKCAQNLKGYKFKAMLKSNKWKECCDMFIDRKSKHCQGISYSKHCMNI